MSSLAFRDRKHKISITVEVYRTLIYHIGDYIGRLGVWLMLKGIKTRVKHE